MTSAMPVVPVLVVLLAAMLHAVWNALAHAIPDRLIGFALIGVAYTVCSAATIPFVAAPARASWPYLLGSVALHIAYELFLLASYQLGDFGQVYPLARGTSPWVVAIIATLAVGEALPLQHLVGVLVISAGLLSLLFAGGLPGRRQVPALAAAFATGLLIAGYTVLDGVGVRISGSVPGYAAWLFLLQGPALPLLAVIVRGRELSFARLRRIGPAGLTGGVLSLAAYGLVLWAQTRGALAAVAALRETSIVFGAVLAAIFLHERFGRYRVLASIVTCIGIALIAT